jgi:hypothetical protein
MKTMLLSIATMLLLIFFRSAQAEDPQTIPLKVVESWSAIIGNWTVEGQAGSAAITGSASFEWAADKHCYVGREAWHVGNDGRVVQLTLIGGWDAATNETVEQGFSSAGSSAMLRYPSGGPSEKAGGVTGKIEGTSGPDRRWSGTVARVQRGPNEFTITTTIDGDVVHTLKFVRVGSEGQLDSNSSQQPNQ